MDPSPRLSERPEERGRARHGRSGQRLSRLIIHQGLADWDLAIRRERRQGSVVGNTRFIQWKMATEGHLILRTAEV